jgi:L-ribulose-5-phosphate 3-epimerase UlaE
MLLSHVLASLCLYISSKAMHSYIPTPFGTPSVSYASFFQVVSPSDIISKWLISMWCQQGREEQLLEVCNDQKTTSAIYKW